MTTATSLLTAAQTVLANWDSGDLAAAMRGLQAAVDTAQNESETDAVPVWYWDAKNYNRDGVEPQADFQIEVSDKRRPRGQLFATIAPVEGCLEDMLPVTLEVSRLPGSRDDVPCLRLHFDDSNMCASFYKQGDRFIVQTESDVRIRKTVLPNGESAFIYE